MNLTTILCAEVYAICMAVIGLLLYWTVRAETLSSSERWLRNVLVCFLLNFGVELLRTLILGGHLTADQTGFGAAVFRVLYFITLDAGVFCWCGYAEAEQKHRLYRDKRWRLPIRVMMCFALALALLQLVTAMLSPEAEARMSRVLYHINMVFLLACACVCSVRLLRQHARESDPIRMAHLKLNASFPLCILAAWLLSFFGESVPVVCVSIMIELLCLYVGTRNQQISMDKLTQVNNRQNLMAFLNYKLKNHSGQLFLMMIDVNDFKVINNTLGHLEGDNALVNMAKALKHCCAPISKRPYIARYGGDEFIIVMEGERQEAEALIASIYAYLKSIADENAPYLLKASIGLAVWKPGQGAKELLNEADERMYEIKNAYHGIVR
ncbi:MAG: GGDEF domain-containing protein [Clostridia bacterium]|nr:GGDEF domain-containing protein [Clostridia bacterium]